MSDVFYWALAVVFYSPSDGARIESRLDRTEYQTAAECGAAADSYIAKHGLPGNAYSMTCARKTVHVFVSPPDFSTKESRKEQREWGGSCALSWPMPAGCTLIPADPKPPHQHGAGNGEKHGG